MDKNHQLPDGWKECSLGEIGSFKNGINKSKEFFGAGLPFINLLDVFGKESLSNPKLHLVKVGAQELETYNLKEGDILFVRSSVKPEGVGQTCVLMNDLPDTVYSGFLIRFRAKNNILYKHFSKYCFYSNYFRISLIRKSSISANTNINQQALQKLHLFLPPLPEQKAIANILQICDTTIEKAEALITAKEKQFDWLTTLLMSPLKNGWSTTRLKYIARIKKGQQINRDTLDATGDYPVWNGGITPSGYTERYNMKENTITISEGGNSCGFVNISTEKFWLGGHCYALEELNDSIILDFLYFYLKSRERRIMRLRVGSGLPNIQRGDIEKLEIRCPDLREQKRIAETLNTARQEIDTLKTLADRYRTQKRGLMQKLLTGKWRVKVNG